MEDRFFRYNQTLRAFFKGAAELDTELVE